VDKWLKYLSVVINYFKKTHTIKGAVIFKKWVFFHKITY
jgi:hypothetical protein